MLMTVIDIYTLVNDKLTLVLNIHSGNPQANDCNQHLNVCYACCYLNDNTNIQNLVNDLHSQ